MNHTLSDSQLEAMIKSAVNSFGPLPPDEKFSQLVSALEELQERRKAAMDSEPFAYIIQDKYERERGVEGHLSRSHVSKYVSQEDINEHEITCTPLYRHAQPAPADKNPLLEFAREYIESWELGMPGDSSLLASARKAIADSEIPQPALVVPDRSIFEKWWESQNGAPLDGWDSLRATDGYCDDGIDGQFEAWNACRAAMLNGGKS